MSSLFTHVLFWTARFIYYPNPYMVIPQDIIWHALETRVSAKMIQRSTFSSPHCGTSSHFCLPLFNPSFVNQLMTCLVQAANWFLFNFCFATRTGLCYLQIKRCSRISSVWAIQEMPCVEWWKVFDSVAFLIVMWLWPSPWSRVETSLRAHENMWAA